MSDNTELNVGTGGDTVRDLARETAPGVPGTAKTQTVQLDVGGDSTNPEKLVSASNPLPVAEKNANIDTPLAVSIVGDSTGDFAGQAILEQVMDDASGLYLNVKTVNKPPLQDARGAQMASDAAGPFTLSTAVASGPSAVIDTTGYNSINIRTYSGFSCTAQCSNDGLNWSSVPAMLVSGASVPSATLAGTSDYILPVAGRYFRANTLAANSLAIAYLRTAQFPTPLYANVGVNITQIGGSSVFQPFAGAMAVGGIAAVAQSGLAANAGNPVMVAGVDGAFPTPLVRRILTDTAGSVSVVPGVVANPNAATTIPLAAQTVIQSPLDPAGIDGAVGALNKVVQYLASIDFLLRELPLNLTNAMNSCVLTKSSTVGIAADVNEFYEFRDDPTVFNQ